MRAKEDDYIDQMPYLKGLTHVHRNHKCLKNVSNTYIFEPNFRL